MPYGLGKVKTSAENLMWMTTAWVNLRSGMSPPPADEVAIQDAVWLARSAGFVLPIYGKICYIPRGMKPLIRLEEPTIDAAGHEWELWSRDGELSLIMDGVSVVTSRTGAAEANMAGLAVSPVVRANKPCIMVAGLSASGDGAGHLC